MEGVETFRCGHPKTPENSRKRAHKDYPGVQCKIRRAAQNLKWRTAHPEWYTEESRKIRKRRITPLLEEQKGLCAICECPLVFPKTRPYHDHDHSCCPAMKGCKKCRRGLLCPDCNTKLAALEKPGWKEKAEKYLEKWKIR
jgi:Recombination endonuclease VII